MFMTDVIHEIVVDVDKLLSDGCKLGPSHPGRETASFSLFVPRCLWSTKLHGRFDANTSAFAQF